MNRKVAGIGLGIVGGMILLSIIFRGLSAFNTISLILYSVGYWQYIRMVNREREE